MNPRHSSSIPRDRWMVSYLDVVTILLIFFIAAAAKNYSAPKAAPPKNQPVQAVITDPPKPDPKAQAQQNLESAGFEVRREPRGLVISLPQAILFSSGDDRIDVAALPEVERIADALRGIPNQVIFIGHADSIPIHNRRFKSNWELSTARGMRLLEILSERYGIDEKRLSVSGDSSNHPTQSNDTSEGRASNRRVELVILDSPSQPS